MIGVEEESSALIREQVIIGVDSMGLVSTVISPSPFTVSNEYYKQEEE